jgi:hypothetical protein
MSRPLRIVFRPAWYLATLEARLTVPPVPRSTEHGFFIAPVSGIELPHKSELRRHDPSPVEFRRPDHDELVDSTHLFYDCFSDGDRIVFAGPPLRNLEPLFRSAPVGVDGRNVSRRPAMRRNLHNVQLSSISALGLSQPRTLTFDAGWGVETVTIRPPHLDVFRGRKVLFTKSKNNELAWIRDWIEFHVRAHGVDAALVYDNASTNYGPDALLDCVRSVPGLAAGVVVPWPYKFGYRGDHVHADYTQYVILEHGRRRFLRDAAGVVQIDVDELVVSDDGSSLFDELARSRMGAVSFEGLWVEAVSEHPSMPPRHRDFRHVVPGHRPRQPKWAAVPRLIPNLVQWEVHGFRPGFLPAEPKRFRFRHFRAISTGWKYARGQIAQYDDAVHVVDDVWVKQMERIGWLE